MLCLIIYRSLRQHAFSTAVTALSIALAGGLLMAVWTVREEARKTFTGQSGGFDAVLGARGSKLQLVLNAVFHLEESAGNLDWKDYLEVRTNPAVQHAIPVAVGDNYRGYRVVGTVPELFQVEFTPGRRHAVRRPGRVFDPALREAVAGSFVADQLGLKRGDLIQPSHGITFAHDKEHEEKYVIVGVLEPSNTPADRVIWIPLEGLQRMSGHDPASATEVSAVLVKFHGGSATSGFLLDQKYNKQGDRLTLAWPIGRIVAQLFDKIGWFDRVLELVAYLVALVASASVVASVYNSINERRRDFAILRALGARRRMIFASVVFESATITTLGMAVGLAIHWSVMGVMAAVIRSKTGVVVDAMAPHAVLLWAPLGMVTLSVVAGMIPAWKAYRTPVAENLAPVS